MNASQVAGEAFTVKEAAERLGISEALLRDFIHRGQLTAFRYGQRKTVIYREDLQKFKDSCRLQAPRIKEARQV